MKEELEQDEIELAKLLSEEIGEEVLIARKDSVVKISDPELEKLVSSYVDIIDPKHLDGHKYFSYKEQNMTNDEAFEYTDKLLKSIDGTLNVEFIKINDSAKLPFQATPESACSDIYSIEDVVIPSGKTRLISTGLKVAHIPNGYKLEVYDRSGMGAKGILLGNGVGQVDSDYRGELKVILFNSNDSEFVVKIGDRIAQVALEKVLDVSYSFVESFEKTERGEGGFGSTGI